MADPRQQASMNTLLKWSIENSDASLQNGSGSNGAAPTGVRAIDNSDAKDIDTSVEDASRGPTRLDPGILDAVFGGPSDAELMKASMSVIVDPEVSLENKLTAFDNFEQLIEGIDNANNMKNLGLWAPLIETLESPEIQLRRMACWCIGTAVQNNEKAQETALEVGAMTRLARLATGRRADGEAGKEEDSASGDDEKNLRRKACYAISSAIRNYQPNADAVVAAIPEGMKTQYTGMDANNMDAVDKFMEELRNFGN